MTTEIIESRDPSNLEELCEALHDMIVLAKSEGHSPETVYLGLSGVTLVRETLTDGSTVMNIKFHQV